MAIQISGCTVIDNSRNITNANNMCVGVVTMTGSSGNIETPGIVTVGGLDFPPSVVSFSPADGATSVALDTNIVITFNQIIKKPTTGIGTTANITLRNSSGIGTVIQTIGIASTSVTISEAVVTINPPSNLPNNTNVFVVVDAGAFTNINIGSPSPLINTYDFTTIALVLNSITPTNSATAVALNTNITLAFNSPVVRGTGTITLRRDTVGGTIIESFDAASSDRISISSNDWILDPTSNFDENGPITIFLVIPNTAIVGYAGLNVDGADSYSFSTVIPELGASFGGGFLICKASPTRWIVSPYSAEVSRSWALRNNANTRAQQVSGCTGWFIPSCAQLRNPGYCCRSFWGPSPCFSAACYWSNTESVPQPHRKLALYFINGNSYGLGGHRSICARAFRCVTY